MPVGSQIEVEWGGGLREPPLRRFALPNAQMRALQNVCGEGPVAILKRIQDGAALFDAVREIIRQGLIGAGTEPDDAEKIVKNVVDPFGESFLLARGILGAWSVNVAAALEATKRKSDAVDTNEPEDPKGLINFGKWWGLATAIGIQKSEFDAMDFADLIYARDGWSRVHGVQEGPDAPTPEQHRALSAEIDAKIAKKKAMH